ncbi:MAG TPA: exonuclease domain-containing protein [Burkholderiales bacterium]|nr:exonuclease domain-containing protein [Burkholderiales bacterium]
MAITVAVVLVLAVVAAYTSVVWHTFDAARRAALAPVLSAYSDTLILLLLMLALAVGLALAPLFRSYVVAPLRLAQATRLIATANAAHRITTEASTEMRELAEAINLLAARYESAEHEARTRIDAARRDVEQEKNRLAALMSELTHGVIVCNLEGSVLLYNNAARQRFTRRDTAIDKTLLGLGRSIFSLIDRTLVAHTLGRVNEQLRRGVARPVVHFVSTTPTGELLRTQMAPIRDTAGALNGYILTFTEAGGELASAERREDLLQSLAESGRAALANVRAAAETMSQAADLDTRQRESFLRVIREESDALASRLDQAARAYADEVRAQWPLEDMPCADLVALAVQHVEQTLSLDVRTSLCGVDAWIRVDSYVMLHVLSWLAQELRDTHGARSLYIRASIAGRHVQLDIGAQGLMHAGPVAADWETRPIAAHGELARRSVRQVMERHGGETWQQFDPATGELYFRLLLPLAEPQRPAPAVERAHESRPEFYDFDLFHQAGQTAALENRALSELAYTVFDTETTGLEPSNGDEIIAIGAVRIVNGRLLPHEAFEQLVDPCRALSPGSARITGISSDMLRGQPAIGAVLPLFHRYCADTVLVAHNAAFDMRFLQLKEQASGVRFTQPVLDTLLLSEVLHPALDSHKLEAIAARHGVSIIGRHTALGDAMVTAEIFIRMIPQLAERGIVTLKEAQQAAQRTYYARVRY